MDVVKMFVEVDSVGRVSGGGGECKHEVRDCTCPGVQNPKPAGTEAELCNETGGVGGVVTPMVSEMNLAMMWLVVDVRGPFQSVQSGGGSSVS
jgi:hypothetical protein